MAVVADPRRRGAGRLRGSGARSGGSPRTRSARRRAGAAGSPKPRSAAGSSPLTCSSTWPGATRACCTGSWTSSTSSRRRSATPTRWPTCSRSTTSPPGCAATRRACWCSSGEQPARMWSEPVPVARCLRAAIAETENLDRVVFVVDERRRRRAHRHRPHPPAGRAHRERRALLAAGHHRHGPLPARPRPGPAAQLLTIEDWGVGMPAEQIERRPTRCSRARRRSTCRCPSGWGSTWSPGSPRGTASRWRSAPPRARAPPRSSRCRRRCSPPLTAAAAASPGRLRPAAGPGRRGRAAEPDRRRAAAPPAAVDGTAARRLDHAPTGRRRRTRPSHAGDARVQPDAGSRRSGAGPAIGEPASTAVTAADPRFARPRAHGTAPNGHGAQRRNGTPSATAARPTAQRRRRSHGYGTNGATPPPRRRMRRTPRRRQPTSGRGRATRTRQPGADAAGDGAGPVDTARTDPTTPAPRESSPVVDVQPRGEASGVEVSTRPRRQPGGADGIQRDGESAGGASSRAETPTLRASDRVA